MISQETIEEIKTKASLVEIVSETVSLSRRGTNWLGLCPFHSEKTPSFNVREEHGYYRCFGCGASGNVFSYVMETRGYSFPEAVDYLASKYQIEVKHEGGSRKGAKNRPDRAIYAANRLAVSFFRSALKTAPEEVKNYIRKRGLTVESAKRFGFGFAPDDWSSLLKYLREHGVPDEIITTAGLAKRNKKGELYDTFRSRLVFPVAVDRERIAGFGGRSIPGFGEAARKEGVPKYLNSPESPVYHKSKILFGLPQALRSIRTEKSVYVVEGYLDVIGLSQVGIQNVVATCGTALTELHVRRLSQLCNTVVLLFDGDKAGRAAAAKSFELFFNRGVDASAIFLAEDEDPDSLASSHGEKTREELEKMERLPLVDCYLHWRIADNGKKKASELAAAAKGKICDEFAKLLAKVENSVEREELLKRAAYLLIVEPEILSRLAQEKGTPLSASKPEVVELEEVDEEDDQIFPEVTELPRIDRELLSAVMVHRTALPAQILRSGALCAGLSSATRQFIEALHDITTENTEESAQKAQIKVLLFNFGQSWISHWKESYQRADHPEVDFEKSFEQCVAALKKNHLQETINQIDNDLHELSDQALREGLINQKLSLMRQIKTL